MVNFAGIVLAVLVLCLSSPALAAQIDRTPWAGPNVERLDQSSKTEVANFMNNVRGPLVEQIAANRITQFGWFDLAGDGRYELIVTTYWPAVSRTSIYWPRTDGTFRSQIIVGATNLKDGLRDISGDGNKELIVKTFLDPAGRRPGVTPAWPAVYRLKDGKYVLATKEFPGIYGFYDNEVIPAIDAGIVSARQGLPTQHSLRAIAALQMERDKILRFLGLDANAGPEHAREWVKSSDPVMMYNAYCVYEDIPGHQADAHLAKQAWERAMQQQSRRKQ